MIHDTAENIIRLAAANLETGTPAESMCIVLPSGTRCGAYDEELRAAGLAKACIASPDTEEQRTEILSALAKASDFELFY